MIIQRIHFYGLSLITTLGLTDTIDAFLIHSHDHKTNTSSTLRHRKVFTSFHPPPYYISKHISRQSSVSALLFAKKVPLASEGSWDAYLDDDGTGFVYYFNRDTGDSLWEKPTSTFPDVQLQGNLRKTAVEKQTAYLESLKEKVAKEQKKGFFAGILDNHNTNNNNTNKKRAADEGGEEWFSSLFDSSNTSSSSSNKSASTTVLADEPPEPEPSGTTTTTTTTTTKTPQSEGFFSGLFRRMEEPAVRSAATDYYPDANGADVAISAPIKLEASSFVLPHPDKQLWGGEDAVMVKGRTFGVFDGVSGALKLDGVPLYSKTLALEMKKRLSPNESLSIQQMTKLLLECAEIADKSATGASTAIVASIGNDGFLRTLNVGDSTCVVIRDGKIAARTREVSHYFDCPYQLSASSPDRPRDGSKLNLELVRDDIIIMGSDGIFDNLSDDQILDVVKSEPQPTRLAKKLSDMSRKMSMDRTAPTPYAKQAKQWGDPDYKEGLGGKLDDVSCVVVTYK